MVTYKPQIEIFFTIFINILYGISYYIYIVANTRSKKYPQVYIIKLNNERIIEVYN